MKILLCFFVLFISINAFGQDYYSDYAIFIETYVKNKEQNKKIKSALEYRIVDSIKKIISFASKR